MRFHRVLPLVLALALLVPAGGAVAQPTPPLDHFLVYEIDSIGAPFTVRLAGQFDANLINTQLLKQTHFANPVKKEHAGGVSPINDPWRHLNWYLIQQSVAEPVRTVRFRNQFGQASVNIRQPEYLLVPAEKLSHPGGSQPPVNADHYKCYRVVQINLLPPSPIVNLSDQFQTRNNVGVFSPRYFCVPVRKLHNGVFHGIFNPQEHLVIYDLSPWQFNWPVQTRDQFLTVGFAVHRSVWLAVPTEKEAWVVVSPATPDDPAIPDGP